MRARQTRAARLPWAAALALLVFQAAHAVDLLETWQATRTHAPEAAVAQAARAAARTREEQAAALWRPSVTVTAGVGGMSARNAMTGARFAAPGFGQASGASFATSIDNGTSTRWSIDARQPLYNPQRRAQGQQLLLGAQAGEFAWRAAEQDLMLRTASQYFDVVLAEAKLALLKQQGVAVERALAEARDRFRIGDAPVTDTHEASARASELQSLVLAADNDLQIARASLADTTGLDPATLQLRPPSARTGRADLPPLAEWEAEAIRNNPALRMQILNADSAQRDVEKQALAASATVDLVAQAGRDRLAGDGDYGAASNTGSQQMVGVQLAVPLYTGGMRSARRDEAIHLAEKARAEAQRARLQIVQDTRAAWLALQTGEARLRALADALRASDARLGFTRLGREVGDRTTLDLLRAENDRAGAELNLLAVRIELLLKRLRLHALAGQLDEARLQEVNALLGS